VCLTGAGCLEPEIFQHLEASQLPPEVGSGGWPLVPISPRQENRFLQGQGLDSDSLQPTPTLGRCLTSPPLGWQGPGTSCYPSGVPLPFLQAV
jgi:hypothetical protein